MGALILALVAAGVALATQLEKSGKTKGVKTKTPDEIKAEGILEGRKAADLEHKQAASERRKLEATVRRTIALENAMSHRYRRRPARDDDDLDDVGDTPDTARTPAAGETP